MMLAAGILGVCAGTAPASADGYQGRVGARPPFSWTGFYFGANGGYAWSNDQTVHVDEFQPLFGGAPTLFRSADFGSLSPGGGFGGVQAGANLQMGAVVIGFEVDGQWGDVSDTSLATVDVGGGLVYTVGTGNRVTKFGTLRPRFGVAWDRTLLYGTAGLAWGRVDHRVTFTDNVGFTAADSVSGTHVGYVVGGGVEHAFSRHVSLKVEYQYINLGSESYTSREYTGGVPSNFGVVTETRTDFHTVRLGLNYKLGP